MGDQLLAEPELANDPEIAARLLASFLRSREQPIRDAVRRDDLALARRLVNGGSHGIERFRDAFRIGLGVLPEDLSRPVRTTSA